MTTEARLMNMDVLVEDGLVLRPGIKRKAIWVKCPKCGPQPPETAWNEGRQRWAVVTHTEVPFFHENPLSCAVCGQDAPYRYAVIPKDGAKPHEKCNQRCLNGKLICNCQCQGRCHGAGVCHCKEGSE